MPKELAGDKLRKDPRIFQAKELLLSVIHDAQNDITGIRPADPELKITYDDLLQRFATLRGNKLFYPYIGSGLGKGALVELLDGSVKYDMISGIGVHYMGHHQEYVVSASIDAALEDIVMQGHLQQNREVIELSEILVTASGMDHCFLASSGAMANENAFKILFQKKFPANRILAFEHCFMGRTLLLAQVTDKAGFREGLPATVSVDYVPFFDAANPEESTAKAINTLKNHLTRFPKQHAMMAFEFVQGEGGFHPGQTEFFKAIMTILKEKDIGILADEVQTFGRTPELFAYQYFGLSDFIDVVTIGKLSQVCATLFKDSVNPKPGLLSQTFTSSSSAIHTGKLIIKTLLKESYFGPKGKINQIHQQFVRNFESFSPGLIKGPFGLGAMIAFTPLDGESTRVNAFLQKLFENGVIGFFAGDKPSRVRFLVPAGAITPTDIDNVCAIVENTLREFIGKEFAGGS